jgi:DNA repair exonuclease SbcCD ATPase subunit
MITSTSATVLSVPPNENQDIIDFLRRLASMLTGGSNAEMLLEAARAIEALAQRAISAERRYEEQQEDHARNLELREVSELASDQLIAEVTSLKKQLAEIQQHAEHERTSLAEETRRLQAELEDAKAHLEDAKTQLEDTKTQLARISAELDEPHKPATAIDHSIAIVPMQSLQLARAQFDFLAAGFARNGDVISQTICQIGACAIDKALSGNEATQN